MLSLKFDYCSPSLLYPSLPLFKEYLLCTDTTYSYMKRHCNWGQPDMSPSPSAGNKLANLTAPPTRRLGAHKIRIITDRTQNTEACMAATLLLPREGVCIYSPVEPCAEFSTKDPFSQSASKLGPPKTSRPSIPRSKPTANRVSDRGHIQLR